MFVKHVGVFKLPHKVFPEAFTVFVSQRLLLGLFLIGETFGLSLGGKLIYSLYLFLIRKNTSRALYTLL